MSNGKLAGGSLASTVTVLATYALHTFGLDVPGEVVAAGASFVTGMGVWLGHRFD